MASSFSLAKGSNIIIGCNYAVLGVPDSVRHYFADYWPNQRLAERYDELMQAYFAVQVTNQQFSALEAENRRLMSLLSARQTHRSQASVLAEVVSVNSEALDGRVAINRGEESGVYLGQAVVDAAGLLGQVSFVGKGSSQVTLLTDATHAVPVEVLRTGLQSIARGEGRGMGVGARLQLPFVSTQADVEVGDILVTSGLGEVFPRDHPVAEVVSVGKTPGEAFLTVYARPLAEVLRSRYVMLIKEEGVSLSAEADSTNEGAVSSIEASGDSQMATPP